MKESMMKNKINKVLLVSDLDGTLLNKKYAISQENEKAIKEFIDRGGLFTIATGRMEDAVIPFIDQLEITIPVVLYNGTKIYCPLKKSVLYEKKLTVKKETLQKILSIHGEEVAILLYQDSDIYTPYKNHLVTTHENQEGVECKSLSQRQPGESLTKIVVIATTHEKAKAVEEMVLQMDIACDMVFSEKNYLEILSPEVSKGIALSVLKNMLEIEEHYTIAIGDQPNDISLMKVADLGIAVGNANNELKEAADMVTVSHEEHAIATVIEQLDTLMEAKATK
ncbi:hypothetical protein SAMN05660297_01978 [Natronincola peptidivorans]|uniref:Cof subfamily of IIB subfamily of haloacid dehalogenase superfamily/HAD-superfamily hydrolase, subfamily IIB n=1 Tax=Natronincola peptidivorans TaxID=426128 RepID=A0A1I0DCJ2_9FIRM|nr:Cof-type HAD-IIB family hydrolase [Natronincola peptidivorans]SET29952.1 hypothetical protein SAMN05660297_01978 [Natronincola peptidivorans]